MWMLEDLRERSIMAVRKKGEIMELIKMYGELGISEKVLNYGREIEKSLHDRFEAIDKTAEYNQ